MLWRDDSTQISLSLLLLNPSVRLSHESIKPSSLYVVSCGLAAVLSVSIWAYSHGT